jgi:hypothetical protein
MVFELQTIISPFAEKFLFQFHSVGRHITSHPTENIFRSPQSFVDAHITATE